jgi:hypothetical protein
MFHFLPKWLTCIGPVVGLLSILAFAPRDPYAGSGMLLLHKAAIAPILLF